MVEQLKLLLDAARHRASIAEHYVPGEDYGYSRYVASQDLVDRLESALFAADRVESLKP